MMRDYKSRGSNLNFSRRRGPNRGMQIGIALLLTAGLGFGIYYLIVIEAIPYPTSTPSDRDAPLPAHHPERIPLDLPPPAQHSPSEPEVTPDVSQGPSENRRRTSGLS